LVEENTMQKFSAAPKLRRPVPLAVFSVLVFATCAGSEEYTYDSPYAHYVIRKNGPVVEMRHLRKETTWLESAVDLDDLARPVVPYTAALYAGVFFKDAPRRVLMVGLGGGGFNHLFTAAFPEAVLHTVEIDPLALELATKHMGFRGTPRNVVSIQDGRQFVKKSRQTWDWIILDAFHAGHVPFHLKTKEFYAEIRRKLAPDGILLVNLHSGTILYDADVKTLQSSFPQLMLFEVRQRGNVIAVAANYESPSLADQLRRYDPARAKPVLRKYVDLKALREDRIADRNREASVKAQVLTDDYCPAEYLNATERE